MDITLEIENRRQAFWEKAFQEGNDGQYWDYAQWVAELLQEAFQHVEGLVGKDIAAGPLQQILKPVAVVEGNEDEDWRVIISDTLSAGTVWPISDRLDAAMMYGYFGVTPKDAPTKGRASWIADLVTEVSAFADRSDVRAMGGGKNAIVLIADLAVSRHALDTGRGEVDIHSLSILGQVSEGRIRNLLSQSDGPFERGPGGGVLAMGALSWLQKRKGFMASIWADDNPDAVAGPAEPTGPVVDPERMIFVPVARDGSLFNPDLVRNGEYQIGAKDEEQKFTSFAAALEALNAMPVPRWRRPNENGNWGIVSGVAWQRVARPATNH